MLPVPAPKVRDPDKHRCAVAHAWLFAETYSKLERAADSRGMHVDRLVAAIIENIVRGAEHNGYLEP